MIATVKYDIGQYSGIVNVNCDSDEEDESVLARARRQVSQRYGMPLGISADMWKVIGRSDSEERCAR
jgi:hypothetical protein